MAAKLSVRFFRLILSAILGTGFITASAAPSPLDTAHYAMKHTYDVLDYKLSLDFWSNYTAPFPRTFSAKEVITFRVDSILNHILLNAADTSIIIDSVSMAGVSFQHHQDTLRVNLNHSYNPGETVKVRISYRHKDVTDHAFYVSSGFVFTDCPPEGARHWFPCWDRPSDKATTDIMVKVPSSVRLGSTGRLSDSTVIGDTIRYHWISTDPVSTYIITITSKTGWQVSKKYWHHPLAFSDSIPVLFYYKPTENITLIRNIIDSVTNFYSAKFGEYHFEKIGFATLNGAFQWGGMENQTMVNLMQGGYSQEDVIVHEHSHQWFGDLITCGTWADVWLNEGFATYCQELWVEHTKGYASYKNLMNGLANQYLAENTGWPLYQPAWAINTPPAGQLYNTAITYNKGACVLFQLRYILGDSLFFAAMKSYATDTGFMFKNAITQGFTAKMSQVSGQDLNWFFNEWVYAPNHPVYNNVYEWDDLGSGNWKVRFTIEQVQTNTVFFRMPVEIKVTFTDGSDTLINITNDTNPQLFEFLFNKRPSSVIFDPDRKILLKQATTIVGIGSKKKADEFRLFQNEPNPFYSATMIRYQVPAEALVVITISDDSGRIISEPLNRIEDKGIHEVTIPGKSLTPGIYLCTMQSGTFRETKRMVVVK